MENLRTFHTILHNGLSADSGKIRQGFTGIGIVFVAMKRNVKDLPEVVAIGRKLGADRFMVTNAVPYAEEMSDESLYDCSANDHSVMTVPRIGRDKDLLRELAKCGVADISMDKIGFDGELGRCPFIAGGSAAITWDGGFSPCLPLMHSHSHYYNDRLRFSKRWIVGNLENATLEELWNRPEHLAFRHQVQLFDFSLCTICHGCILNEENEEDCLGNAFPTCGGCLWAQGYVRCP
ncbi:MAG: SPASM domain-containing protein [Acidobacteria bacterium]|nr:SPASM domain-containing protein [Acidobacteriota bacterium]